MTSLWLADRIASETPPGALESVGDGTDVLVVGAGITGLTVAALLARAGKKVVVIEARYVGAGTTGNTTGKVSLLQGSKLSRIAARHDADTLRAYVSGNREGMAGLLRHCDDHGLSVQREDAYSYAQSADGVDTAKAELRACRDAGLDVTWEETADVPFPYRGGVRLCDQAQLDPVPVLSSLVVELETHGGVLAQGVRVESVSGNPARVVVRETHTVGDVSPRQTSTTAPKIVLATGIPILDRGLFFARVKPQRSYCLAFDVPGGITRSMYLSVDSPTRSVRSAATASGDKLVVGGAGHVVGRRASPGESVEQLSDWTKLHYPGASQTHFWSAQDYSPADELPYVGPILPGNETIFVATGFDKWGITNGVAAALALSSRILGGHTEWAMAFSSWRRHELSGIPTALRDNVEVGINMAKSWVAPALSTLAGAEPAEGAGVVTGPPWHMRAHSVVDGVDYTSSPVCPHLGGIVNWNDVDLAW